MKRALIITVILGCLSFLVTMFYLNKNDINSSKSLSLVKGSWVADGTQSVFIIGYEDDKPVYSDKDGLSPYYLDFDGEGRYTLKMNDYVENGTYSIDDEQIIFKTDKGMITEECELQNKNELHCSKYASKYIRKN